MGDSTSSLFIYSNQQSKFKVSLNSSNRKNDDSLGTVYYAISMFVLRVSSPIRVSNFILHWTINDGLQRWIGCDYRPKMGEVSSLPFCKGQNTTGSLVVFTASFVITFFSILFFELSLPLEIRDLLNLLFITLLTAIFSTLIELTGIKGCDNLSLPIGSGLFASLYCILEVSNFIYIFSLQ